MNYFIIQPKLHSFANKERKRMNKNRRKRLNRIVDSLEGLSDELQREEIESTLSDSQQEVEMIADEEQEALDMMPENLAFSQRYEDMSDNVSDLEF